MNTAIPAPINAQPAGPVELYTINRVHISTCAGTALAALAPNASAQASGPLFVASYNAFDKAGRDLGIDAAELATRIDLAGLIRAAREASALVDAAITSGNCARFADATGGPMGNVLEPAANLRAALACLPAVD